jgi:hypothetical protein
MRNGTKITIEIGDTWAEPVEDSTHRASVTEVKLTVNGEVKEGRCIISPERHASNENILANIMKDPFIYENLEGK